jgi:hypothetical protein
MVASRLRRQARFSNFPTGGAERACSFFPAIANTDIGTSGDQQLEFRLKTKAGAYACAHDLDGK